MRHSLEHVVAELLPAHHPDREALVALARQIDADHTTSPSLWSPADDRLAPLRAAVLAAAKVER